MQGLHATSILIGTALHSAAPDPCCCRCVQVGLSSINPSVVCAAIRVAGAVLQALLMQQHHTANSPNSRAGTQQDHQIQQEYVALPPINIQLSNALSGLSQQPGMIVQTGQQQCRTEPDWLDGGSSLVGLQARASAAAVVVPAAAAAPHTLLEAVLNSGITDSGTAVSGVVGAVGVLSAPDAATAADLMATLTAHARGEGSVSTSGSTSNTSSSDSSASSAAVGVRVSALLELQQLMLMLADTDTAPTAAAQHSQELSGPCTQRQGSISSNDRRGRGNNSSTGVSFMLGPSWLQSVLGAAMEALSHADPSLRRWVLLRLP